MWPLPVLQRYMYSRYIDSENKRSKFNFFYTKQIVGIGLCGVFELIKETRQSHPALCSRALQALLDMLQGQIPEGLKTEPPDVIGM